MASKPSSGQGARGEIAAYLRAQAGPLHAAAEAQKRWAPQLQQLFETAKLAKPDTVAFKARALGREYVELYRRHLKEVETLQTPPAALRYQEYSIRWLKGLINACEALLHAPEDGRDQTYLRDARDYFDDARYAVKPMAEIRQRLHELAVGKPAAKSS